ncbi:MAG: HEAT repeat domain-containing protein [Candidatus Marinimicrobia bacterium]|nr:HEAT repeat domain-containing protein [Candidatus Neomarinimicrobiota bacterium]
MKRHNLIILLLATLLCIDGCSMIKKFWPGKKSGSDDISYELIENLRTSFSEGRLQALEEMIAIYNDTNQPFDVRIAAGKALAETQHPTALNAISETVGEAAALDVTFMVASIELLSQFRDDPRAADAMVAAMNKVEEKTNSLQMALVQNLNKVRTKDQVLALLDLYEVSRNNFNRTEKLLTETLGALGTDEVIPILTQISRDPEVNLGIRNRALEILGKKDPSQVASAFAELLGDPQTNLEVQDFALNTMKGIKEENLILALLQTYRTGKDQYYNLLTTLLEALGEFNDPEIRNAVKEIAMHDDYPLEIRMKAIEKLSDLGDETVVPTLMPILSDPEQYKLHTAVIQTVKNLGQYDAYEQEIHRRTFEAHQKAVTTNE